MAWEWIKRVLGVGMERRLREAEIRKAHNEGAVLGAVAAFKQFAKDAER